MIFVCDDSREIERALLLVRGGDKLYYRELQDGVKIRSTIQHLQKELRTPSHLHPGQTNRNGANWLVFYF